MSNLEQVLRTQAGLHTKAGSEALGVVFLNAAKRIERLEYYNNDLANESRAQQARIAELEAEDKAVHVELDRVLPLFESMKRRITEQADEISKMLMGDS